MDVTVPGHAYAAENPNISQTMVALWLARLRAHRRQAHSDCHGYSERRSDPWIHDFRRKYLNRFGPNRTRTTMRMMSSSPSMSIRS